MKCTVSWIVLFSRPNSINAPACRPLWSSDLHVLMHAVICRQQHMWHVWCFSVKVSQRLTVNLNLNKVLYETPACLMTKGRLYSSRAKHEQAFLSGSLHKSPVMVGAVALHWQVCSVLHSRPVCAPLILGHCRLIVKGHGTCRVAACSTLIERLCWELQPFLGKM